MNSRYALPHHRLVAFSVAKQLLAAVRAARIRDAEIRRQAEKAAVSVCLNIAEGAGRTSARDKARVFGIALGETTEAVAAVEIAVEIAAADRAAGQRVADIGRRLGAMLHVLARAR